jgi:hypothetical protein
LVLPRISPNFYHLRKKAHGKEAAEALVNSFLLMPGMAGVGKIFDTLPKNWSMLTRLATALERFADPELDEDHKEFVKEGMGLYLSEIETFVTLTLEAQKALFKIIASRKTQRFELADKKFARQYGWEIVEELDFDW